jgi:hypothetical protein
VAQGISPVFKPQHCKTKIKIPKNKFNEGR